MSSSGCEFLGENVFIKVWYMEDILCVEDAMDYLRNKAPQPILLMPLRRNASLTVVVKASECPRIEFGRRLPSGNRKADLEEIISILKANGVEAIGDI